MASLAESFRKTLESVRFSKAEPPQCAMPTSSVPVKLPNVSPEVVQEVTEQMNRLMAKYPGLKDEIHSIGLGKIPGYGQYSLGKRRMLLHRSWAVRPKWMTSNLQQSIDAGFLAPGVPGSTRYVVTHETGHAMTRLLRNDPRTRSAFLEFFDKSKATNALGQYAARDKFEAVAEAFSQVELVPRSAWSPYTRGLAKILEKLR